MNGEYRQAAGAIKRTNEPSVLKLPTPPRLYTFLKLL
jgi:hypothetical protein